MHGCVHACVRAWFRHTTLTRLYTNHGAGTLHGDRELPNVPV